MRNCYIFTSVRRISQRNAKTCSWIVNGFWGASKCPNGFIPLLRVFDCISGVFMGNWWVHKIIIYFKCLHARSVFKGIRTVNLSSVVHLWARELGLIAEDNVLWIFAIGNAISWTYPIFQLLRKPNSLFLLVL